MGAVAAGRLGTTTAFILLPLLAQAAARMLTAPPRAARRAAWATGLLTAITAAFVPLVWVIVAGILLVLLAARRWAVAGLAGSTPPSWSSRRSWCCSRGR